MERTTDTNTPTQEDITMATTENSKMDEYLNKELDYSEVNLCPFILWENLCIFIEK